MTRRFLLLAITLATGAGAQEYAVSRPLAAGQGWSVLSGQTLGAGSAALTAQAGFPGLSLGYLRGISSRLDAGGEATFNYALEGSTQTLVPGFKLQGVLRFTLLDSGTLNLGLRVAPGPLFYFFGAQCYGGSCYPNGITLAGLTLPVDLVLGLPVGSAIMLSAGLSLPFFFTVGPGGQAVLPILAGAGAEYFITRTLSVSFSTRMGPAVASPGAYFVFEALLGAAYHL